MVKPYLVGISPFDYTLYLDADTRIKKGILIGFSKLDDYDICVSTHYDDMRLEDVWKNQKYQSRKHIKKIQERDATIELIGDPKTPFLNSGVIFFKQSYAAKVVFSSWYKEWCRYKEWDEQMALHRAIFLNQNANIYYMPEIWNQKYLARDTIIWHQMGSGKARK